MSFFVFFAMTTVAAAAALGSTLRVLVRAAIYAVALSASILPIMGLLYMSVRSGRWTFRDDGIAIHRPPGGEAARFVPWTDVASLQLKPHGIVLVARGETRADGFRSGVIYFVSESVREEVNRLYMAKLGYPVDLLDIYGPAGPPPDPRRSAK